MNLQAQGIYEIDNFLTKEECKQFIEVVKFPPQQSTCFTDTGVFKNRKWIDDKTANFFYTRLTNFVTPSNQAKRANNLVMTGYYTPGEQFNMHTDTGLYYNRKTKEKTRWTLLIYLNDNYEGGHTLFYDDEWKQTRDVQPKEGKALLFDIDLWHRGEEVLSHEKYWIGCEIIGNFD